MQYIMGIKRGHYPPMPQPPARNEAQLLVENHGIQVGKSRVEPTSPWHDVCSNGVGIRQNEGCRGGLFHQVGTSVNPEIFPGPFVGTNEKDKNEIHRVDGNLPINLGSSISKSSKKNKSTISL